MLGGRRKRCEPAAREISEKHSPPLSSSSTLGFFRRKTQWGATDAVDTPYLLCIRTCVVAATATATATARRGAARAFQKGLSGRGVALSRGRRPRRSSHPPRLPQRREPPPRGGRCCWTIHASTSRRRRNVPRRPLPLLLALSPVDSALTARAHICMRVPVSFSSLSLPGRSLSLSIAPAPSPTFLAILPAVTLSLCPTRAQQTLFPSSLPLSLSFSRPRIAYNERTVTRDGGDRDVASDDDDGNDGRRARARALSAQGPCLSSARLRVCVCVYVCAHFSISATRRA